MSKLFSLPEEIQVDILLRLPVNSILICKWVCRPWRNLIRSRKFIKYHLKLSIQKNNPRLMVRSLNWQGSKPNIYTIDYASMSSSASISSELDDVRVLEEAFQMDYPFECNEVKRVWILGSCHGLICLGISSTGRSEFDEDSRMYVWNPTTREYKKIPILLNDLIYDLNDAFYNVRYGFGYDCNTDDYKVVRIDDCASTCRADVYSLASGEWKTVHTIPCSFRNTNGGVLFNGALHWLGGTTNRKTAQDVIISFNISNEILIHVPFPKETVQLPRCKDVGVLADCLCLYLGDDLRTEVWVMQAYGVRETWTRQFSFTQESFPGYVYPTPIWSLRNGEILISTNDGLILYNPQHGMVRDLNVYSQGDDMCDFSTKISHQKSYVQSLVSLGSGCYVAKTNRVRNGHIWSY